VTGVDGRYTGRDTGSIITTGGIESMLDQATLIDAPKVFNYEMYTKRLTQLIIENLIAFGGSRKYYVRNEKKRTVDEVTIDFTPMTSGIFDYSINISTDLPRNRARIAQIAKQLMDSQLQYSQGGSKVDIITPEEYLMCQDLPNKEYMLERMGIQRSSDYMAKVTEIIYTFGELVKNNVDPNDAIGFTAAQMQANETPGMEQPAPPMAMPEMPMQEELMPEVTAEPFDIMR
jgi:hypothetical protein